jgi:hypothetical protein
MPVGLTANNAILIVEFAKSQREQGRSIVDVSGANAKKLRSVLLDFGFGEGAPSAQELARRGKIWMLGRKPWRIDLLTERCTSTTNLTSQRGRAYLQARDS